MGNPLSVIMSDAVMDTVERRAKDSFLNPPKIWLRFKDDTYAIMQSTQIQPFFKHLNEQVPSIRFTKELEQSGSISFLDVKVTRNRTGMVTSIYRKPTHTDQYINFQSHHPLSQKIAIAHNLYNRADHLIKDATIRKNKK